MSGKLPALTGKELIAVLEAQGWYVARVKGSHHVMRHPEIPDAIPVPVHGQTPLKRGTARGNPAQRWHRSGGVAATDWPLTRC